MRTLTFALVCLSAMLLNSAASAAVVRVGRVRVATRPVVVRGIPAVRVAPAPVARAAVRGTVHYRRDTAREIIHDYRQDARETIHDALRP